MKLVDRLKIATGLLTLTSSAFAQSDISDDVVEEILVQGEPSLHLDIEKNDGTSLVRNVISGYSEIREDEEPLDPPSEVELCHFNIWETSTLKYAAQTALLAFAFEGNRGYVLEECLSNPGGFTNDGERGQVVLSELVNIARSIYGTGIKREFRSFVENFDESTGFRRHDGLLLDFISGDRDIYEEELILKYREASKAIKDNEPSVAEFMEKAATNPYLRPLHNGDYGWESERIDTASDAQFVVRRLMDLGYGPTDFRGGLEKLDSIVDGYESFLIDEKVSHLFEVE